MRRGVDTALLVSLAKTMGVRLGDLGCKGDDIINDPLVKNCVECVFGGTEMAVKFLESFRKSCAMPCMPLVVRLLCFHKIASTAKYTTLISLKNFRLSYLVTPELNRF